MKLSTLDDYFHKDLSVEDLRIQLHACMHEYVEGRNKKGTSMPLIINEDRRLHINRYDIVLLCNHLLKGEIEEIEINYICDLLLLSESVEFEDEEVKEIVEEMTDPEVNGSLSKSTLKIIHCCRPTYNF